MSKFSVIGAGKMGVAVAYALNQLGHEVSILDKQEQVICDAALDGVNHIWLNNTTFEKHIKNSHVISCLPYHQNYEVAHFCIKEGLVYVDLGGCVGVSNQINNLYKNLEGKAPLMTDVGLAPGLVNILLHKAIGEFGSTPEDILIAVGGLPKKDSYEDLGPLKYTLTWSLDGLINEYKDDCLILNYGDIVNVSALSGYETLTPDLEAFRTSGGAAHTIEEMRALGVKNCEYKTIRYKGHHQIINFLMNHSELTDDKLKDIFKKNCPQLSDMIYICIRMSKGHLKYEQWKYITGDWKFSGMAKSTGFTAAAIGNHIDKHLVGRTTLSYADFANDEFFDTLRNLGV